MASLHRTTGFLAALALSLALSACGSSSTTALNTGNAPGPETLRTEFSQENFISIGDQLRGAGDYGQALAFYQRAEEADPSDYRSYKGIGLTWQAMGATDNAMRSLAHAAMLNPADIETREALAKLCLAEGRLTEAKTEYQWLITQNPEKSAYYNGLAVTSDLLGDHADAQANYSLAMSLAPLNKGLRNNLALSFAFAGNFEAAEEVLSDMQDTPRSRQNLALVYGLAGKRSKAQQTALQDLSMPDVQKNMALYDKLRGLPSDEQAAIVLLGHPIAKQAAALSQ